VSTPTTAAYRFSLPDERGEPVRLEDYLGHGPVALVFYRGDWCVYCNGQLASYVRHLDDLERLGARVLAISTDSGPDNGALRGKLAFPFPVLSDADHVAIDRYAGIEPKLRAGIAVGKPATFVLDRHGEIVWSHIGLDFADRPLFGEVLEQLAAAADRG
jgi:peroxiredoxin